MGGNATATAKLQTVVVRTKQNETFSLWSQRWSSGLFGNTTTPETLVRFCCCRCHRIAAGYVISWGGWRSDVLSFRGRIPRGTWRGTRGFNHHCSLSSQPNRLSRATRRGGALLALQPGPMWSDGIHFHLSLVHSWWEEAAEGAWLININGSHTTVFKGLTQKRTFGDVDMYDLTLF